MEGKKTDQSTPQSSSQAVKADLLGIDPSYRRTGICLRTDSGFVFHKIEFTGVLHKNFIGLHYVAEEIAQRIGALINHYRPTLTVIEEPPPRSSFSGGMYLLVSHIAFELLKWDPMRIHISTPAVGRAIFKNKKWSKGDSVRVASPYSEKEGRLTGDEGDAFVMLIPFLAEETQKAIGVKRVSYPLGLLEKDSWRKAESPRSQRSQPVYQGRLQL